MLIQAYHGWAGGAFIWNRLAPLLNARMERYDHGFFGMPVQCSDAAPDMILLHSMGAAFVPWDRIPAHTPVVWINGFDHFAGTGGGYQRLTGKALQAMRAGLLHEPDQVLRRFYSAAGGPMPALDGLNAGRLDMALVRLEENRDESLPLAGRPLLAVFSENDRVAAHPAREILKGRAKSVIFEATESHLLPLTHAEAVSSYLHAWLPQTAF